MSDSAVTIGAGQGAAQVAISLRQGGFKGPVVIIGAEPYLPYQRPPLSKKFLSAPQTAESLFLRPQAFWRDQEVTLELGTAVGAVDRRRRCVMLTDGRELAYASLVFATGTSARTLPIPGVDRGVHSLRNIEDVRRLRIELDTARSVVIIGGGYIGLEVAAAARVNGVDVTIVEREQRVLARVASHDLSAALTSYHRERGITILTNAVVRRLTSRDRQVQGVVLGDGTVLPCDVVVVGVGAAPRDELGAAAGLHCDQGIVVDGSARTSDPSVYAIGDVTRRPVPGVDEPMRLESIPSATEQARQACASILGAKLPDPEVPWFWSDQFDLKLKIAGVVVPGHHVVRRGDPRSGKFALYHHDNAGEVIAVETANAPAEFMAAKRLLRSRHAHSQV